MAGCLVSIRLLHVTTVSQSLNFLRGNVRFIQAKGFTIEAISSYGADLDTFGAREGIPVHAIEMPRRITPVHDLRSIIALFRYFLKRRPIIVHAHTPKGGLLGMIGATIARVPVRIYHVRGLPYMTAKGWRKHLLMTTERISCRLAHRTFCVSHSLRDVAISDGICPESKIVVFAGGSGNGVDAAVRFNPDRYTPEETDKERCGLNIPADARVILFVGRIVRDKGIVELAEAWKSIRSEFPDTWLILAGPQEPQDPVSPEVIHSLENDARVVMPGNVSNPAVFYALADLVVLPTYREGFPNVPLEAAAMEVPVIATRIPGCSDAVEDGVTGTLVPSHDADALADAMRSYLMNPELRAKHGKAGRKRVVEQFQQEVIWEAMYQEYCRLLREKGLPVPEPVMTP